MKYISLVFHGPQSWGKRSVDSNRPTDLLPSKSAIIGLIGNAMGLERSDTSLFKKFKNINVDCFLIKGGIVQQDYHTINSEATKISNERSIIKQQFSSATINAEIKKIKEQKKELKKAIKILNCDDDSCLEKQQAFDELQALEAQKKEDKRPIDEERTRLLSLLDERSIHVNRMFKYDGKLHESTIISHKEYISDSTTSVVIESEDEMFLKEILNALKNPKRILYIGRKKFFLDYEFIVSDKDALKENVFDSYEDAISSMLAFVDILNIKYDSKILTRQDYSNDHGREFISNFSQGFANDMPISFSKKNRAYEQRMYLEGFIDSKDYIDNEELSI